MVYSKGLVSPLRPGVVQVRAAVASSRLAPQWLCLVTLGNGVDVLWKAMVVQSTLVPSAATALFCLET